MNASPAWVTRFGFSADRWIMPTSSLNQGRRELAGAPKTSA